MDRTQAKLEELSDNLSVIEVCLLNEDLEYGDIAIYLQYDVPLEETSEIYAKLKRIFDEKLNELIRLADGERREALAAILNNTQQYIKASDKNGSHLQSIVFKDAYTMAEVMKTRLIKNENPTPINVPSVKKAAV
jgi:hypothetical protein